MIDPDSGTLYLIAMTKEGNQYVYRLHALDVANGAERSGSPVKIQPSGFDPLSHKQRTSLLLSKGVIYSTWSGHCDQGSYHGWVLAHDAKTLKALGVLNTSPFGSGSSFWNGGAGPAADAQGNIFAVSANGDIQGVVTPGEFDEEVLQLSPAPQLSVLDSFRPFDRDLLNQDDLDLGSSGALLLPDAAGSPVHPHLLFTSGKEGRLYLLDRQSLGGVQSGNDSDALASLPALTQSTFGTAAYFNGAIYVAPEKSPMFAFPIANATLRSTPSAKTPNTLATLGATPSISANGDKDGIVWVSASNQSGELFAYDAGNLKKLFDSGAQPDQPNFSYSEFSVPTIADGKVFVPTQYGLAVYGELAADAPKIAAVADAAAFTPDSIAPGSLISIFGSNLAPFTAAASSVPLPLSIADVSVTINGVSAPILFISPGQINVQMPYEVAAGSASLIVRVHGTASPAMSFPFKVAAPSLFMGANGQAAAINADSSSNTPRSPAAPGSSISLFFTGQGPVSAAIDDGDAPKPGSIVSATASVSATIGGLTAEVQFTGLAPGFPGVAQINLKVPALAPGVYPVVVTIAGVASNAAQLAVAGN